MPSVVTGYYKNPVAFFCTGKVVAYLVILFMKKDVPVNLTHIGISKLLCYSDGA